MRQLVSMLTVMTGGTRGIGLVAAGRIQPAGARIMGVRQPGAGPQGWEQRPLDLASLASVRAFVAALPEGPISHLVLNAGGQRGDIAGRTVDGFETTFATNHLAHYLLLRLVMGRLANGARIVITTSGTHDPKEKTGVPAPKHANAAWLAHPERNPQPDSSGTIAGMRAYSSSKLCNLLTALYLAQSEEARAGQWSVFAYDPGLTPGTGLIRNQPWIVRTLIWPLLPLAVPFSKGMNSLADAGRGLAELALSAAAPDGHVYAALRKGKLTWPEASDLARDDAVMRALWRDSAELVEYRQ
jgi:NAD(P)-dependent dehydrogenase (short-subunit alcohol dehydrogenase family)